MKQKAPESVLQQSAYASSDASAKVRPGVTAREATSLIRALRILELIARKSGGCSNSEISRRLKLATSTTCYILSSLEREGYVKRTGERGRYEIGMKIIALAHGALREMGLRRAAEPILHRLVAETGHSALIGVLENGLVMIVDKVEQPDLASLDMDIGVRYPAHSTALGKVLLANLPPEELSALIDKSASGRSFRPGTPSPKEVLRELSLVKKQGYSVSDGHLFIGFRAIAAPILDAAGVVRAAVSATGISRRTGRSQSDTDITTSILRAAREISARLVWSEGMKTPRAP